MKRMTKLAAVLMTAAIFSAQGRAQTPTSTDTGSTSKVDALQSTVSDLKTSVTSLTETVVSTQAKVQEQIDSPSAIHYKGIAITPIAFFAAEGVWRQHSVNSDINTPLNSIPFPSANEGHVSELNFSGRQSRLGGLFEANPGTYKLSGYFEADFLGVGTSSNNNQSNSYVLRQRQFWGKAETQGGFTVTGGQMWSLVTEDRKGTDARTEIQPNTIDAQYLVGYSWTRQPGFRVQQRWGDYKTGAVTVAMSVEQAQITNFTASNITATEFFFAGVGQNGGLYNTAAGSPNPNVPGSASAISTYANNVFPDFLVKTAIDYPVFHFELGAMFRFMRDYYFPVTYGPTGTPSYATNEISSTSQAGGVFGAARAYIGKVAEVALEGMAGTGLGRYGSSQLADATLKPDETLEPIKTYHGLLSIETHLTPKLDAYVYYGGEYAQRTVYQLPYTNGPMTGYGPKTLSDTGCYNLPTDTSGLTNGTGGAIAAVSCASPTRYIQEAMGGVTYKVVNSPKYGKLQYQLTYSYIQRNLWSGVGSATTPSGPRATEPMVHVSMRYYIP